MTKFYTPTGKEQEEIERAMLAAAWKELQPLKDDGLSKGRCVLACLSAFKAAYAAERTAKTALREKKKIAVETSISYWPQTTVIVCSAMSVLDLDPSESHPTSVLGGRLACLLQSAQVLEAMGTVQSSFDDDMEIFGTYTCDEATAYAEIVTKNERV